MLASLALGAAQRPLSAWRLGIGGGGVSTRADPVRAWEYARDPRPLGVWVVLLSAQLKLMPKGRVWAVDRQAPRRGVGP